MPRDLSWYFPKPFLGKNEDCNYSSLHIDETELNIIWLLGKKGDESIYDLKKTKYDLPKYLPNDVHTFNSQEWKERSKKQITYHYPSVLQTVKKLAQKGLVTTLKDSSGDRTKRMVRLTFQGLILYLRNTDYKQKFVHAIEHYRSFIPFAEHWESMVKQLGEEETVEALESTLKNFQVHNVRFRVKPLGMEFEGFLEGVRLPPIGDGEEEFIFHRNQGVADYLRNEDARMLRDTYIAYLALNDIKRLRWTEKRQLDASLTDLESERELAYFESRQVSSSSLFRGGRIKEFLPKYSRIEYFFTGMFVNNLLWNKRKVERHNEYTDEFDVEYLWN
jgi:DNA-binding MarR family transcriptional regulator